MKRRILILATTAFSTACLASTSEMTQVYSSQAYDAEIIPVTTGYLSPYCSIDLDNYDVLPTLEAAFDVALPILKRIYPNSFKKHTYFKGYLHNDSVWVIYGYNPQPVEGGHPYIEISKHDGRILKIMHNK